jgi:hypothetical protein
MRSSRECLVSVLIVLVMLQVTANLALADDMVVRKTETTEVRLRFTDRATNDRRSVSRYWGAGNRRSLSYPALSEIEYSFGSRRYGIPNTLVLGIGSINIESIRTPQTSSLVVRDDDRWTVITLLGADGSNAFIAEWRIERRTGCVIRYVRDLEAPGRVGTAYGPEILSGQAVDKRLVNSARASLREMTFLERANSSVANLSFSLLFDDAELTADSHFYGGRRSDPALILTP